MPTKAAMVEAVYTFAKTHKVVKSGPIECAGKHVHSIQPGPKFIKPAKATLKPRFRNIAKRRRSLPSRPMSSQHAQSRFSAGIELISIGHSLEWR